MPKKSKIKMKSKIRNEIKSKSKIKIRSAVPDHETRPAVVLLYV
jgi:hypothetical protein